MRFLSVTCPLAAMLAGFFVEPMIPRYKLMKLSNVVSLKVADRLVDRLIRKHRLSNDRSTPECCPMARKAKQGGKKV